MAAVIRSAAVVRALVVYFAAVVRSAVARPAVVVHRVAVALLAGDCW